MTNALAIIPEAAEMQTILSIADMAVKSRLIPSNISTKEQAAIIILKGRELGLPPLVSFAHIHVIQGKPTMSAEILLAHIYKDHPTAQVNIVEKTSTKCVLKAKRPNETEFSEFTWDMDRAKKMGLDQKDNWKKQPETMLFWRAITEMKRAKFPEVCLGVDYSREELEESGLRDAAPTATPDQAAAFKEPKVIKNYAPKSAEEAKERLKDVTPTKTETLESEPPAAVKELNRNDLSKQVAAAQAEKKWTGAKLMEFIKTEFNKTPSDLDLKEMAQLVDKIKAAT